MMTVGFEYGYRHNEWLAVYTDEWGDRQIVPFDTFEQAVNFLCVCPCMVGVMTTAFYVNRVTDNGEVAKPTYCGADSCEGCDGCECRPC